MAQFTIPPRESTKELRYQMGYALADLADEFPNIVALDADLRTSSGLHIFEHFHPAKLIKAGIAEQNMISMAAGLSQEGFIPFPCTFDAFCRRFMDQLYVTVAYSNLNVKVLGAYVGLFTGKAGATHQSDKELGLLLRIPKLRVIEPGLPFTGKTLGVVNGASWTSLWSAYFGKKMLPGAKIVNVGNEGVQLNFIKAHRAGEPCRPQINIDLFCR
jgi:hypothetical protein